MKTLKLAIAALVVASSAYAQDAEQPVEKKNEFQVDVQLRARAEYRNGAIQPGYKGDPPAFFINERARLGLGYLRKNLELRVGVQHVGVWGQDPQVPKAGRVMLHEAWGQLTTNNGKLFARIGRQQLAYDGDRILGTLDWNVAGRWHDAVKLGYQDGKHFLHLIVAYNANSERITGPNYYEQGSAMLYKTMQAAWYHFTAPKHPFNASFTFLNIGYETGTPEKSRTDYLQTLGTKLDYGKPALNVSLEAYYQFGHKIHDVRTNAYMFAINGQYKPINPLGFTLGFDYLSGDSNLDDKNTAFDPLYGTHHKFYGFMDYFYASLWNQWGLMNPHFTIDYSPSSRVALQGTYHYFLTAADPTDSFVNEGKEKISKGLGSEVDLQFTYKIFKDVTLQVGYSMMFGTKTMDLLKGGDHKAWQDWGWIQLNINPRIFNAKW